MTPDQRTTIIGHITRAERALCNASVAAQANPDYAVHDAIIGWLDNTEAEIAAIREALGQKLEAA